MEKIQIQEFEISLLNFVNRAAKESATAEEIEALPAVASVLKDLIIL